jgi:hypothetical protein
MTVRTSTWRNFEDFVKLKILYSSTSSNSSNKGVEYGILEEAKKTYKLDNYTELIQALSGLLLSSKCSHTNINEKCYSLPELTYLKQNGATVLRSWKELFPKRAEVKFGSEKNNRGEISEETWEVLERIFEDWRQAKLYPTGLSKEADEIIETVIDAISKNRYAAVNKKNPKLKKRMKKWLEDYEKLTDEQKKSLKEDEKLIRKDYNRIRGLGDDGNDLQPTYWERVKDFKNWPWMTIAISFTVVAFVLLLIWIVKKMLGIGN